MAMILKRRLMGEKDAREDASRPQPEHRGKRSLDPERVRRIMEALELHKDESLDTLLRELIAAQDDVRPEEVTLDYIREQREKRFYPSVRYDTDSRYGGYNSRRLRSLTRDELDEVAAHVTERLKEVVGS